MNFGLKTYTLGVMSFYSMIEIINQMPEIPVTEDVKVLYVSMASALAYQVETVKDLLFTTESITVIGLLLAVCFLLIWDKIRQETRYQKLLDKYEKEQEDNKNLLIQLVEKSILATEKNTQAINMINPSR